MADLDPDTRKLYNMIEARAGRPLTESELQRRAARQQQGSMTGVDDLATWLRAQLDARERELDEDERVAQAATAGPWWHNPGKVWLDAEAFEAYDRSKGEEFVGHGESPFSGCVAATGPSSHAQAMNDAQHIARWDPDRVLRMIANERTDIDAKRRILDLHHAEDGCCYTCSDKRGDFVERSPCPTVRLLALPMAGRDGYREEWRP